MRCTMNRIFGGWAICAARCLSRSGRLWSARLPWPGWAVGLFFGVLLSIPDAIITKAYAPIIGLGAVGGTIIGIIIARFGA